MKLKNLIIAAVFIASIQSCSNQQSESTTSENESTTVTVSSDSGGTTNSNIAENTATVTVNTSSPQGLAETDFTTRKSEFEGSEYTVGVQKSFVGDFTGDGLEDVAIFFSLEGNGGGTGNVKNLIALYKNNGSGVDYLTKFSPNFPFELDEIASNIIRITKLEYAESDASCCPSLKTFIELTVKGNKISQQVVED